MIQPQAPLELGSEETPAAIQQLLTLGSRGHVKRLQVNGAILVTWVTNAAAKLSFAASHLGVLNWTSSVFLDTASSAERLEHLVVLFCQRTLRGPRRTSKGSSRCTPSCRSRARRESCAPRGHTLKANQESTAKRSSSFLSRCCKDISLLWCNTCACNNTLGNELRCVPQLAPAQISRPQLLAFSP